MEVIGVGRACPGARGWDSGQRTTMTRVGGVLLWREVLADRWESSRRLEGEEETL